MLTVLNVGGENTIHDTKTTNWTPKNIIKWLFLLSYLWPNNNFEYFLHWHYLLFGIKQYTFHILQMIFHAHGRFLMSLMLLFKNFFKKLISSLNICLIIIPLFLQPDFLVVIKILISQENAQPFLTNEFEGDIHFRIRNYLPWKDQQERKWFLEVNL